MRKNKSSPLRALSLSNVDDTPQSPARPAQGHVVIGGRPAASAKAKHPGSPKASNPRPSVIQELPSPALGLDDIEKWVHRLNSFTGKCCEALVALGQELARAKAEIHHGEWGKLFASRKLKISQRSAERLIKVAGNAALANSSNSTNLPASKEALFILSRLDAPLIEEKIVAGHIHPEMTLADARLLVQANISRQEKMARAITFDRINKRYLLPLQELLTTATPEVLTEVVAVLRNILDVLDGKNAAPDSDA